ncbi:MAG: NAD-dependent epimerase/dehydratase [Marmoricola sp.]|nr:NAD-dependent epimerase/dehydratase [Marmoricola sp.]
MRIFMTGASGWIGSAVVPELLNAGHQVVGLARSDSSAAALEAVGVEVRRGSLDDLDSLAAGAADSEGVVHLGYNHDFSQIAAAAATDVQAIEVMGEALVGTGGPLLIASGVLGLRPGGIGTEDDRPAVGSFPRIAGAEATLALAERGVRGVVARFAPTVHGAGDHGFVATLVEVARTTGVSAYVGDGSHTWPAVHRSDAARLVRLAVDHAPGGSVVHAVAEQGVPTREIAEAIARNLGIGTMSVGPETALEHFGWIGRFFGAGMGASNAITRNLLGWAPAGPGLLEDLDQGHYFTTAG